MNYLAGGEKGINVAMVDNKIIAKAESLKKLYEKLDELDLKNVRITIAYRDSDE